jgi:predicted enzyme related to lactoylglutathione lyase
VAKVLGLGGIFFKCDDRLELAGWYQEHLGFPVTEWGGVNFDPRALPKTAWGVWSPFAADSDYFEPSAKDFMINLVVDDVEGVLARARAGGAEIIGQVEEYAYGRFGGFMDPAGNKIELWQPPK